jgi:hypothetical protein
MIRTGTAAALAQSVRWFSEKIMLKPAPGGADLEQSRAAMNYLL